MPTVLVRELLLEPIGMGPPVIFSFAIMIRIHQ